MPLLSSLCRDGFPRCALVNAPLLPFAARGALPATPPEMGVADLMQMESPFLSLAYSRQSSGLTVPPSQCKWRATHSNSRFKKN